MKQKIKFLFAAIIMLSLQNVTVAMDEGVPEGNTIRLLPYSQLAELSVTMVEEFHRVGYIAIENVPGFEEAYENFLSAARKFTALSPEQQATCTPQDYSGNGWSSGVETFNGKLDTYKGSYYAKVPNESTNVWPDELVPELRDAYQAVATIVLNVAQEILPLIGFHDDIQALGRMLHYKAVPEGEDDGNPNWCGKHCDHGLLTGLCPEVYYNEAGEIVDRPEGSGLYIEGIPVAPRRNVLLFQMGEFRELMANGEMRATEHWVQKAPSGFERYAMAVFFDPPNDTQLNCTNPDIIAKYADRYEPGITYKEWGIKSYAKYNPEGSVAK
ncbi:MAG: 2OG-Fe(II) oxygenase family protein [Pseudomonadota bacterium]|jgi:isopenicillin N synthase-like dioxygenase|nr:hypothetical protein [Alphaproteobacteria bacterium]